MDCEEDRDPAEASLAISNVLHNAGSSASVLRLWRSVLSYLSLFCNLLEKPEERKFDTRIIGSFGEGIFLLAMANGTTFDIDIMLIFPEWEAYEHADVIVSLQHSQFQMEPCENNSGYVKLKVIKEGKECLGPRLTSILDLTNDAKSNIHYFRNAVQASFLRSYKRKQHNNIFSQSVCFADIFKEPFVTGPSFSLLNSLFRPGIGIFNKVDQVLSIPCPTWPSVAVEWVKRKREYGWPSKDFILEHEQQGCYVVPVGCKECERCDLDWRLSFVLVEKALIWDFNITQVHCLQLLKQLKTFVFEKYIGDMISSYILKTTVFWMIEESSPDLWVPHCLLTTVKMCLDRLISFVQNDFCPNYFIRTCNLLATRYTRTEKKSVIPICLRAIQNTRVLLCQTPPFNIALSSPRMEELVLPIVNSGLQDRFQKGFPMLNSLLNSGLDSKIHVLLSDQHSLSTTIRSFKTTFLQLREMLPNHDIQQQHAANLKKQVGLMYIRFVWTHFYLRAQNNKCRYRCIRVLRYEFTEMNDLVEAVTICHLNTAIGNYTISNETLKIFISKFKVLPYVPYGLNFRANDLTAHAFLNLIVKHFELVLDESNSHMQSITDILFSRFEIDLLPPPMQMEMCTNQNHGEHFDFSSGMSGTVAVDPLVYACFLRFWCCVKLDQNTEKLKARDGMVWCCGLPDITNKAVAYTLLGFCHKHLNEHGEAFRAFCTAWKQNPRSDATLVHMLVLVYITIRQDLNESSPD